ncbi:MAG: hypothetical protein K0R63_1808 [Rickettsiales bacterium]|jgi:ABC-type transport system involved in multi-copper enzyme maturation permease subunit|nr:hypothetical protein [Rickettsiales bacterium]
MKTVIRYVLLTASRDWLFLGLFIANFSAIALSAFLGNTAIAEEQAMTISYIAGSVRTVMVVGLILFVCFHVRRAFDHKEIELMLSRPLSRTQFMLSYWLGFIAIALAAFIPIFAVICAIGLTFAQTQVQPIALIYWGASIAAEVAVMVGCALLSSLILRSAVSSVMFCFGFYILSRMMGFFIAASYSTHNLAAGLMDKAMEFILLGISIALPRLDLFGKSEWLLYGIDKAADTWIYQSIIYIPLLLAVAVTDFRRKQF